MRRHLVFILFLFLCFSVQGQRIRLEANIDYKGTTLRLPSAIMMVTRFSDSSLVSFTRSNDHGIFPPIRVPLDTYLVVFSHPNFNDLVYVVAPSAHDSVFDFKNMVLPSKSITLDEVVVVAPQEKSYFRADTLIFTADSFKAEANVDVEELLKKLPGLQVNAGGKIMIQGKEVDRVLVDGEEFFGTDPTIATRNLIAISIENIKVYDQKNENVGEGQKETLKIINLKLKDKFKTGFLGKASGGSDFNKFHEGDLSLNRYSGKEKFSIFGNLGNTPKQTAGSNSNGGGIPKMIKTGIYFSDHLNKSLRINTDYSFLQSELQTDSRTNTQFFLSDTTYSTSRQTLRTSKNQVHNIDLRFDQQIDSFTTLAVIPKINFSFNENSGVQTDQFVSEDVHLTRETRMVNETRGSKTDVNVIIKVVRNFIEKGRQLTFNYQPGYNLIEDATTQQTDFSYYQNQQPDSSAGQKWLQSNLSMGHDASLNFLTPLNDKFRAEFNYSLFYNHKHTNRQIFDYTNQAHTELNPLLSNEFDVKRMTNRLGSKLVYDVKKYQLSIGGYFRNVRQENLDFSTQQKLNMELNNILPFASFTYRIGTSANFSAKYLSSSQQPDIQQMQPVRDNSDPNHIVIGNPDLKPTFTNNLTLNYFNYMGATDIDFHAGLSLSNTLRQISNTTNYDAIGRTVSQPVNIDGNKSADLNLGGSVPIFKRFMKMSYSFSAGQAANVALVNGIKNISQNRVFNPGIILDKIYNKVIISFGGNYAYTSPQSNINTQSNQPYYSYNLQGSLKVKLPKKVSVGTNGNYTRNGNRSPGYNLNPFILNASVSKTLLKGENMEISLNAFDIFNQNISNQRSINGNQIVDTQVQIIRRYFLFKLLLLINSQKMKKMGTIE